MFWYWEEGNLAARRAPDAMVIKGVGRAERRSFFSWREHGAVPGFIVEVISKKNWRENYYEERRLYAELGVREYFLFDPEAVYLRPALQGFRRCEQGVYVSLEPDVEDPLHSEELGLYLRAEGTMLRLIDAQTGHLIPTREERAEQERQRAEQQQQRAERLEAEVARLQALLAQARPADRAGPAPQSE